jgi:triacylglycerol esterase/lipase EstA (alpha/beta hydrolase family)
MDRHIPYMAVVSFCLGVCGLATSCAYIYNVAKQSKYSRIQETNPSQRNQKHMIDRQTFFVYGRIVDATNSYPDQPIAVAAFSNRYVANELVDVTHVAHAGTHYGLNLPDGAYELLVLADQDQNGVLDEGEIVGRHQIELSVEGYAEKVADNIDIRLSEQEPANWVINIPMPEITLSQESLFFPKGSIRDLNDPVFETDIAILGLYEPAAFLEAAPTMFYALEEDSYKIPVVFVHGIGGSAREFAMLVSALDEDRYKPWFFYYPSGSDLDQLAEMFYEIFLSGHAVAATARPYIVVAHSMGGLVVREALNKYQGNESENPVDLFITIASPLGGHPAAAMGEERGLLVVPSWRDLNPDSSFIKQLYRKPLAAGVSHHLLYTYGNPETLKLGENSDGVVPLSSQLRPIAQSHAAQQFGFNASHTGVLNDPEAINYIVRSIEQMKSPYPESHIQANIAGGYDVVLNESYTDKEKYYIRTRGKYMSMLADGTLDTLGDQTLEHFVEVAQGRAEAKTDAETAWLKFSQDYPRYAK